MAAIAGGSAAAAALGVSRDSLWVAQARAEDPFPTSRDVYKWPFAPTSIWNMPVGAGAQYHHARFLPYDTGNPPQGPGTGTSPATATRSNMRSSACNRTPR